MTDTTEEAAAAEADIAEKASTLDMPLHLRIDRELDAQLRRRAAAEQIPTSALVRRLLRQAVHVHRPSGLAAAEVEDIARRVAREELHGRRALLGAALLLPLAGCGNEATEPGDPTSGASTADRRARVAIDRMVELEERFQARLGVHATRGGVEVAHRADERFALCSTFKVLAAAAVLDRTSPEHLDKRVSFSEADLVPFSPITEQHLVDGLTIRELGDAAIRYSDNTAGNLLLDDLGGPGEVTAFARSLGDRVTRLDRREPDLNSAVPGDDRDTTSPRAIAADYRELSLGARLDDADRDLLTGWLVGNTTGSARIRAGLPPDWRVGDKTGAGRYGTNNDVAIIWPPGEAPIVLAVLSSRPGADAESDDALIAEAAAIVADTLG